MKANLISDFYYYVLYDKYKPFIDAGLMSAVKATGRTDVIVAVITAM